jgi:hypothetical protein
VPEISRFFGIVIAIYYNDHPPPHFHAKYGEYKAKVEIESGLLLDGSLPGRVRSLVEEWRMLHKAQLEAVWRLAMQRQPLVRIEPLE